MNTGLARENASRRPPRRARSRAPFPPGKNVTAPWNARRGRDVPAKLTPAGTPEKSRRRLRRNHAASFDAVENDAEADIAVSISG